MVNKLSLNPEIGTSLGENIFKIRIPNSSIPVGKSGGFRVVIYYKTEDTLYLVTIYSKTEQNSILIEKLKQIIKEKIKKN